MQMARTQYCDTPLTLSFFSLRAHQLHLSRYPQVPTVRGPRRTVGRTNVQGIDPQSRARGSSTLLLLVAYILFT